MTAAEMLEDVPEWALEPVAGGKGRGDPVPAGRGAFGVGDALDGTRCVLGCLGHRHQAFGGGLVVGVEIKIGELGGQQFGFCQPCQLVLGRDPGHRHGAVDQFVQRAVGRIGGRDNRHALAHEDPQAQIGRFRAFQFFERTHAPVHRKRGVGESHGIGTVGTGLERAINQIARQIERFFLFCHGATT